MQVRTLKIDKIGQNWNVKLSFVIRPHPQKQYLEHMGATLSLSHFSVYQFFNLFPFFGPTKQYVQRWKKVDMWSRCCKFNPLDPTKQYVHCMLKVTTWCHFENLPLRRTFKTVRLMEFTPTGPFTAIHSTYGSSWHVDSFFWIYLPCPLRNIMFSVWTSMASWLMSKCSLLSPTATPYVEHMERKASWVIYSRSTVQSNTLKNRWKLTRRVIFYDENWHA